MVEIERVSSQSLDIEEVNKEKLKSVFPECFAEGKLDIDKLLNLCGEYIDNDFEKYKFEWKGKSECYKIAGKRSTGTLRPCKEESVNFDTTNNLYIEGDNLEVLKLLQTAYYRRVKMIYIDPPYNTGNDFVYEDDFKDPIAKYKEVTQQTTKSNPETMGRYHTNWLNMMYPRLRLASNLLRDDGVIFISIDDNEVTNLRKLCDEVFGEENFVADIIWKHTQQSKNDELHFSRQYNHTITYAKNIIQLEKFRFERTDEDNKNYSNPDNDPKGLWRSGDVRSPNYRPTMCYDIQLPNGNTLKAPEKGWRWSEDTLKEKMATGEIIFKPDYSGIIRKIYLCEQNGRTPENLWAGERYGTTRTATAEIKELFDNIPVFDTPKPKELVMNMLQISTVEQDIILDFFSGSATTAHAVMQLNAEDGGSRRFICVQLPELCDEKSEAYKAGYKNICEIGKERIRRAGEKIAEQNSAVDVGFKVFKLDSSNLTKWDSTPTEDVEELQKRLALLNETIKPERNELDVVYEAMLKLGIKLDIPVKDVNINDKKAYLIEDNDAYTLICLDYGSNGITADDMKTMCEEYKPTRIVASEQAFKDDIALSNAHYILKDHNIEMKLL